MADENRNHQVSLGCGTLILIALIVVFFGNRGIGQLENEVRGLQSEIRELKSAVEAQNSELKQLVQKLDKQQAGPVRPREP